MFYLQENFISNQECENFISLANNPDNDMDLKYGESNPLWSERLVDITNHHIVNRVSQHFKKVLGLELEIDEASIQNWIVGSESELHTHETWPQVRYNSLIYLNNNFEGGEFYTPNIKIQPEPGLLTLFDGTQTKHGLSKVKNNDRFTLIFWWRK